MVLASSPGHHIEGVDKIFSFESVLVKDDNYTLKNGSLLVYSSAVPSGKVWVVTVIGISSGARAMTALVGGVKHDGTFAYVLVKLTETARYKTASFTTQLYLDQGDQIFFLVDGGQNGDVIYLRFVGYQMNAP